MQRLFAVASCVALLGVSACGPPIGVKRVGGREAYRSLTSNALSSEHASEWTRTTVNGWGLLDRFDHDPEDAIRQLREIVISGRGGAQETFALSELSFRYADSSGKKPYYLAAAVYAYAFLFPKSSDDSPGDLDPRTRLAADIYNSAITLGFASSDGRTMDLAAGTYPLPFGTLEVATDQHHLDWGDRRLVGFVPVAEFTVWGLRNRHRLPGIGAPLAARTVAREGVSIDSCSEASSPPCLGTPSGCGTGSAASARSLWPCRSAAHVAPAVLRTRYREDAVRHVHVLPAESELLALP